MKRFFYSVRDSRTGELLKGWMKAADKQEASVNLRRQQYLIMDISEYSMTGLRLSGRQIFSGRIFSDREIAVLCRQLSIMLKSGIELSEALAMLADSSSSKRQKNFLLQTIHQLKEGKSLSEVWQKNGRLMPEYLISSLQTAEYTGMLAQSMAEAAVYLQKNSEERRRLHHICVYPAFLLLMLTAVAVIMIFFVLPVFNDIFERMDMPLPLATQLILSGGILLRDNMAYIALLLFAAVLAAVYGCQKELLQLRFWQLVLRLPGIGNFCSKVYLLNIMRQLEFLQESGIAIGKSLDIMIDSMGNLYFAKCLQRVKQAIEQGFSLAEAFKRAGVKNSIVLQLLGVGEASGRLAESLHCCCEFLSEDIEHSTESFMRLLEPSLMVAAGLLVGSFVVAIVIPLFEMVSGIGM